MTSLLSIFIIIFLIMSTRKGRSDRNKSWSGTAVPKRTVSPAATSRKESFSERYREDPAATAGMTGRTSSVPAAGRSAILEADGDLDEMLAGRKYHTPGKDITEGGGFLDTVFAGTGRKKGSRLKDSSLFAGFEDRQNDWLARQLREEQHLKARMMSDMMSLKMEHERKHRQENRVIGKR